MQERASALPNDVDACIGRACTRCVGENGGVDVTDRPVIGIFGAGKVGTALARLLVASGYDVRIAGSPRQTALDLLVSVVAPGAQVVTPDELVAAAEVIIVAVPFGKAGTVPWEDFGGRIVVDAMNYWPPVDGHIPAVDDDERSTSEINASRNPLARVVKSFNHVGYHEMEDDAMDAGSPLRRAIAVVGDDADARAVTARLIDDIGFDAVDGGPLVNGRALEPGHPAFGRELSASELAALLAPAAHLAA
jgi:predicted dinucleotide-binding enzyme